MTYGSFERGVEKQREMWGDAPASMLAQVESEFNRPILHQIIGTCFGEAWASDALTPKVRSLITVGMVAAMGRTSETRLHVRWALLNGCTPEELREVIKHVAAYAGAPAGAEAAFAADEVIRAEGVAVAP
ncbi:MAG TPA: carboxymuconolactone decarboxylase family protein [Solirubrobacteraceae bacterium]|nr:carboxymuconolactone decarboxylase family protein [Solirubrobacteraceae bacterium]